MSYVYCSLNKHRPTLPCLRGFFCQFVPNLVYYLAPRISQIRCRYLECAIMIDYRKKHKTLSYLYVLTVTLANVYHECGVRQSRRLTRVAIALHKPSNTS